MLQIHMSIANNSVTTLDQEKLYCSLA